MEDVALEMISSLGEPGALVGEGTMPYPGNSRVLEAPDVAETVKETKLRKTRLLLGEAAVPGTSGLLGGATHLVHSVDVEVRVTVEMVVVTSSNDTLPEVTRLVTGQVVKVV